MLNKRVEGFYRGIKSRGEAEWVYTPIKTRPESLLNDFKNIKKTLQNIKGVSQRS